MKTKTETISRNNNNNKNLMHILNLDVVMCMQERRNYIGAKQVMIGRKMRNRKLLNYIILFGETEINVKPKLMKKNES